MTTPWFIKFRMIPFTMVGSLPERSLYVDKTAIQAIELLPDDGSLSSYSCCRIYINDHTSFVVRGTPEEILEQLLEKD